AGTPLLVAVAAVLHIPALSTAADDDDVFVADTARKKPTEQVRPALVGPAESAHTSDAGLLHFSIPLLNRVPQFLRHDPKMRRLMTRPLCLGPFFADLPPPFGIAYFLCSVPHRDAVILFI